MSWGQQPQGQTGQQRTTALVEGKDGKDYFMPLEGVQYHVTIPMIGEWLQPMEIWTHDVLDANGNWTGNIFCKKMNKNDSCPLCTENELASQRVGRPLKNAERPSPLKKKYIFPVIVDEIPEKPFVWLKTFEKFLIQISEQMSIMQNAQKLIMKKTGKGRDTVYTVGASGVPVNQQAIDGIKDLLPSPTRETFINACDYSDFEKGANQQTSANVGSQVQQPIQQQNVQQTQNNVQQQQSINQQQPINQQLNLSAQASNFVITFGAMAGKKLVDLSDEMLKTFANNMVGDIQTYAVEILNARSKNG